MHYRERVQRGVATAAEVRFEPGRDTVLAVASLLAFWGIYYVNSTSDSAGAILLFLIGGNLLLTVLLPAYYVCGVRDEPLSAVGLTTRNWTLALAISAVVSLLMLPGLLDAADDLETTQLAAHVVTVGLMLWEPFFVHGWLQIRFERAFGALPGIALAAASFVVFHVGATAVGGLAVLLFFGLVHGALFRLVGRNLLVLWPLLWAVGGSQGTLESGLVFGREEAFAYVVLLIVTAAGIALIARR